MQEKKAAQPVAIAAGILFILMELDQIIRFVRSLGRGFISFSYYLPLVLVIVGLGVTAVALLARQRNIVLGIGFGFLAISPLFNLSASLWAIALYSLFRFITYSLAAFLSVVYLTAFAPRIREKTRMFWFLPVICLGVGYVFYFIYLGKYSGIGFSGIHTVTLSLSLLAQIVGLLLALYWAANTETVSNNYGGQYAGSNTSAGAGNSAYCGLFVHVLLLLFTFGIWALIWIYRMTDFTNKAEMDGEGDRNPTTKLLLCMFIPFYQLYWTYKTAQRIDRMANRCGIPSDISTLCLVLAIFVPIVPPIIMQDKVNTIVNSSAF